MLGGCWERGQLIWNALKSLVKARRRDGGLVLDGASLCCMMQCSRVMHPITSSPQKVDKVLKRLPSPPVPGLGQRKSPDAVW
jgi:hypothetical protein